MLQLNLRPVYAQTGSPVLYQLRQADDGATPQVHSKADITNYITANNIQVNTPVSYAVSPSLTPPYAPGSLSDTTQQQALKTLNLMRYIAGIDPVSLDDSYEETAQAGAMVNAINGVISHFPTRPTQLTDDALWNLAYTGTSSSNLGQGYPTLGSAIIDGWVNDGDPSNITMIGHRRWVLNPTMAATGFGYAGDQSAMYSFDSNHALDYADVAWPARTMPLEYFGNDYPWSVSTNTREDLTQVKVSLVRLSDGKTWHFSQASADGYFNVDNQGYGQPGCIIFRPSGVDYKIGDNFNVTISGLSGGTLSYTVDFVKLGIGTLDGHSVGVDLPSNTRIPNPNLTWTGTQIRPTTLEAGSTVLRAGVDFTASYSDNTAIGRARMEITGIGNYSGSGTIFFNILPATPKIKSLKSGKKKLKVSVAGLYKGEKLSVYQLRYRIKGKKAWTSKTISAKSPTYWLKKLKSRKEYQVAVRCWKAVSGINYYSAWSGIKASKRIG
ncbi:MAG: CAP domain-containing protein [Coriobacteriales bacterium]|nr:CAP domain-containing protein [Coriobacteriales bacterium]